MIDMVLLGGPYDGVRVKMTRTPPVIVIGEDTSERHLYELCNDPGDGSPLVYVWKSSS